MRPPLIYRMFNAIRAYCERDTRLLVPHWKDVLKPEPRKVLPMNLEVRRGLKKRRVA